MMFAVSQTCLGNSYSEDLVLSSCVCVRERESNQKRLLTGYFRWKLLPSNNILRQILIRVRWSPVSAWQYRILPLKFLSVMAVSLLALSAAVVVNWPKQMQGPNSKLRKSFSFLFAFSWFTAE